MTLISLHEMGEVIRRVRKERGLRLEDLADENISPATVSNIERGVAHVSPEKVTYLLDKLDIPVQKLPEILEKEQQELQELFVQLQIVSTLREIGKFDEALQTLDSMPVDDHHPLIPQVYYSKGRCYFSKKKYRQAERAFHNAIRSAQQGENRENNIESAGYLMLGVICYLQNSLSQALTYANQGLNVWVQGGERLHIRHLLLRNKGVCLQRLGRITEGMQLIQEIWDEVEQVDRIETKLMFYWLRADFSKRSGFLDEAIQFTLQGITLARRNGKLVSLFELWTLLGSIYLEQKKYHLAEQALETAQKLRGSFPDGARLASVYTQFGLLSMVNEELDKSYEYFLEAITISKKYQDAARLISNLSVMGEICRKRGQTAEAIEHLQQAVALAEKHEYKEREAKLWMQLASCYEGIDDKEFIHCMRKTYSLQQTKQESYIVHNDII
ncbi:helix-turn-helix domain-containing protein [Thermoactinomyces sp. DSM 45892]|uniref:helix-turn-helix domain-containing protein n=1 Tax=Thermoactinomyces sp. DSM 45892 TaxID=1882753 RepID=UPI00089587D9|nr:helix-turn-helix domain-containing protein [Thermoactinomyces sp. DSM 45892]SDZ29110.1 Tetratricopeptide repeat-containing protein [Thermoactinomyces sp. DSM 45892]